MSSRWWYGVAASGAVWGGFVLLPEGVRDGTTVAESVDAWIGYALLASWIVLPAALYLDWRAIREEATWSPSIARWCLLGVVWLANVAVAAAYVCRRRSALRGEVPSAAWYRGVLAGTALWIGLIAASAVEETVPLGALEPVVFGPVLFLALLGLPVAVYLDLARVRGYADWDPIVPAWVLASAVPIANVLVAFGYAYRRRRAFATTEDPTTLTVSGEDAGEGGSAPTVSSPWYGRALGTFCVHFLLVVVLAAGTDLSETGIELLAVALWLPFGLAFAAMTYLDLEAITDQGVDWGPTRYLYLLSVIAQAAAFFYLLRRYGIVSRRERRLRERRGDDPDDGPEIGGGGGPDGTGPSAGGRPSGDASGGGDSDDPPSHPLAADAESGGGALGDDEGSSWAIDAGSAPSWEEGDEDER